MGLAAAAATERFAYPGTGTPNPARADGHPATAALTARAQQNNGGAGNPVGPVKVNFSPPHIQPSSDD
jgi:hypothetical protein